MSSQANMDDDDIMVLLEWQLQHIENFGNEKQLDILLQEIGHIMSHGLIPSDDWFNERFQHIYQYSQLGWLSLANRFQNKDVYLYDTATYIIKLVGELVEEVPEEKNTDEENAI